MNIIDGWSDPTPWTPPDRIAPAVQNILGDVHRLMRRIKRGPADHSDIWGAGFEYDCQGRVAAAMGTLSMAGFPLSCMRGYTGGAYLGRSKISAKWQSHAVLGVCIHAAPKPVIYVLDDQQEGVRTLHWMQTNALYKSMSPRMRMEP